MIKIKLVEPEKHRNECAFRPFVFAKDALREIGVEFTLGDSYDYAWIAQGSLIDQSVPYQQCIDNSLEFLSKISGDYMIIDGQDSASLMYTFDLLKYSKSLLLLKNSLYKDRNLYKQGTAFGRSYWGEGDFKVDDFDMYSDKIKLSGTNWIATHWSGINSREMYPINRLREYDVCALFQYPSSNKTSMSDCYDNHRKNAIDVLNTMPVAVAKLTNGVRLTTQEYYMKQFNSKIVIAPFGAGEMAPRDLEAALFGNILIKPDMSHIDTAPNMYTDMNTYVACKHDFSDLEEKIHLILGNFNYYTYIIENCRKRIIEMTHPNNLAIHLHSTFLNLKNITI
jgi:hypothetical protein